MAAFILYLNSVNQGGETEFLYQSKRIKPKQGRILLFPTSYTHVHRGNPPLKGNKFILTGWVEMVPG
ncbi:2OG-Fe(II) oxygenase [bacterium]|nr:2OG-Fe(II) oxygenase [bacterium]